MIFFRCLNTPLFPAFLQHPNVLVMTTSNITDAIDLAFVDRADIKQYIGPPGPRVRYDILKTCVDELMRVGIVAPSIELQPSLSAERAHEAASSQPLADPSAAVSAQLYACSLAADGFSGRALRKLPFLAHTLCSSNAEVAPLQVRVLNCVRMPCRQLSHPTPPPLSCIATTFVLTFRASVPRYVAKRHSERAQRQEPAAQHVD